MAMLFDGRNGGCVGDAPSISGGNIAHLKHNQYQEIDRSQNPDTSSIDAMMREVLHMLGNIGFQHDVELERADRHSSCDAVKDRTKRKIRAAHHEKRETYVELLATLRQRQHRLAS